MTTKEDFSAEEWNTLLEAPMTAAMYIIIASPSVFGSIKESYAVSKGIALEMQKPDTSELLRYLLAEFKDKDATKAARPDFSSKDPAATKQEALQGLGEAVALLEEKATPAESAQIRDWLYQLAVNTANASKEGGFLGIGAVRVNEAEKTALAELAEALQVEPSEQGD